MSMSSVYIAGCGAILVAVVLILARALIGPTIYDRVLAVNAIGTKTVILLVLLGALMGRTGFTDIAILYALVNFVATIVILKFISLRRLD